MRIGIHTSIGSSLAGAAQKAHDLGANCFQIFSASPRMWAGGFLQEASVAEFRRLRGELGLSPLVIHDSYLINMASPDAVIRGKSIDAFRRELLRAGVLGADYLVMHPGSARGATVTQALATIAASLEAASMDLTLPGLTLLFENTAGSGETLGRSLEELRMLRDLVGPRLSYATGYCLDTCHLFAAGFDIITEQGLRRVSRQIGMVLGWENVHVIHTNDSLGEFGSCRDRHANIGKGHIGVEGFRRILGHTKFRTKAFILETPNDQEGDHQRDVDLLKELWRNKRYC